MGQIYRDDPTRRIVAPAATLRPTQPNSSNPYASFIKSITYAQAVQGDSQNKQQNQKPNPPNSTTRPPTTNIGGTRGPNTHIGTVNGGNRGPNTHIGTANGGSRGPNTHIGTANGGSRGPNTNLGTNNGGSRGPNANLGTNNGGSRGPNANLGNNNGGSRGPNTYMGSANGGTVSVDTPLLPLRFGSFDSPLPNTSHQTSPPQTISTSSSAETTSISSSDIPKLQRLIKLAIIAGRLRSKCTNCGNSVQHCCEQAILEAVSSLPPYL